MPSFGEKIHELRKMKGWTLRDLAHRADLSAPFLSQLERGEAGFSEETVKKLSVALDVDPILLKSQDVGYAHIPELSKLLRELSELPPDKIEAIRHVIAAMKS